MSPMNKNREITTLDLDDPEVTTEVNTTGEFSSIVDIQVPNGMRYEFPSGKPISFYVYTHESGSVSANSDETVSLSNYLVNSPSVRDVPTSNSETSKPGQYSLVVWDDNDDIQSGVKSVDYANNQFDYSNSDGSQDNLEIWYLWGDKSQVEFREYDTAEEGYDKQNIVSIRQLHQSEVFSSPSYVTFSNDFSMKEKQHLKIEVKTDVDLTYWDVTGPDPGSSPGNLTSYGYSDLAIPVRKVSMRQ